MDIVVYILVLLFSLADGFFVYTPGKANHGLCGALRNSLTINPVVDLSTILLLSHHVPYH
jgi:hypothetical protein